MYKLDNSIQLNARICLLTQRAESLQTKTRQNVAAMNLPSSAYHRKVGRNPPGRHVRESIQVEIA